MDNKAMQGWLAADPPPPPRTYAPGEERKWYKMMGAAHLLPWRESHFSRARDRIAATKDAESRVTCEEIERKSRELHAKVIRCQANAAGR